MKNSRSGAREMISQRRLHLRNSASNEIGQVVELAPS